MKTLRRLFGKQGPFRGPSTSSLSTLRHFEDVNGPLSDAIAIELSRALSAADEDQTE